MNRWNAAAILLAAGILLSAALPAQAFRKEPGPPKDCRECHAMTPEEAGKILKGGVDNVVAVLPGPIPGIWEIDVRKEGRTYPLYLDYSGKYLFNGQVIRMNDGENLTGTRYTDLNRVDLSSIPLEDAIVFGDPGAGKKVVVFDDPDCPWCRKLHEEIKQVVARSRDVAFFVRVYSRNGDPQSIGKARSILCGKPRSAHLLEDAFAGKKLPPATCDTRAVEETAALARKLGIQGTPAMILPDGRLINGYLQADALLKLLEDPSPNRE